MSAPALDIVDLHAGYLDEPIVTAFSASFPRTSITTIVGGNGAGKSTVLKAIYGLNKTFSGAIRLAGDDVVGLAPKDRLKKGIGFVPQGRCNFPAMTVRENLLMGLYSVPKARWTERMDEIITTFPLLRAKWKTLAGSLSGGEQQILETAMVLLTKPMLLLLDEPTLGLSPKMQQEVFAFVLSIRESLGVTCLIVEQNVFVALAVSDRAIVMDLGRKVREGSADEIAADPELSVLYLGGKRH